MKRFGFAFVSVCVLVGFVGFSGIAHAKVQSSSVGTLENSFLWSHQKLEGEWREGQKWAGWLCEGFYNYKIFLQGAVKNLDLELTEDGKMRATVDLSDLFARVQGAYRSSATACLPMGGWLGAGSGWAKLKTEITFGDSGDFKDVKLKILSTELGRLRMGSLVPQWFEDFFTGVLNRALTVVWNSRMGAWISDKATSEIIKRIPDRGR